ncbi:MAG: pilus assembly protein PilB, partial [Isosphaeraceae bacterium]
MARRIGTILQDMGYLDEEATWRILEEQSQGGGVEQFGKIAMRLGLISEDQLLRALGEQLDMKVVSLADITIPAELCQLINQQMAEMFKLIPLSQNKKDKSVTVAMARPEDPAALDSVRSFLGVEVKAMIASEADVNNTIQRLYVGQQESI